MAWILLDGNSYNLKLGRVKVPVICILMLFTLAFRLLLLSGMGQGDDLQYAAIADRLQQGVRIPALYIFDLRWFVVLPTAFMYKVFGINDFSSLCFPILLSVLSVYLAWLIMNHLTDGMTAIVTALFYSVFPLVAIYGTFLQVAVFLEFATLLTLLLFIKAVANKNLSGFIYAGLAASLIPMARMSGVLIFILLFFYLFYMTFKDRAVNRRDILSACVRFSVFIVFSLLLLVVQGLVYAVLYNDFFYRIDDSQKAMALQNLTIGMDPKDFFFYVKTLFLKKGFYNCDYFGFFGYLFFPAMLYCVINRLKASYYIIAWCLGLVILMTFAPSSLSPYIPLIRNIRYMIVLVLPMIGVCVMALMHLVKTFGIYGKTLASYLFFILPLVSIINSTEISASYKHIEAQKKRWSYDILALSGENDNIVYVTDMDFPLWYGYYSEYKAKSPISLNKLSDIKRPGILLLQKGVHPERYTLNEKERNTLWRFMPDGWRILKEDEGKRIVKVFPVNFSDKYMSMDTLSTEKPYNLDLLSFDVKEHKDVYLVDQDMLIYGDRWQQNNHLFIGASKAGAEIVVNIDSDIQGQRDLTIGLTKAPDFGVLDIFLNNKCVLQSFDLYHDWVMLDKKQIGKVELIRGVNTVRFVITGKNSKSSGFKAGIDYIELK